MQKPSFFMLKNSCDKNGIADLVCLPEKELYCTKKIGGK